MLRQRPIELWFLRPGSYVQLADGRRFWLHRYKGDGIALLVANDGSKRLEIELPVETKVELIAYDPEYPVPDWAFARLAQAQ